MRTALRHTTHSWCLHSSFKTKHRKVQKQKMMKLKKFSFHLLNITVFVLVGLLGDVITWVTVWLHNFYKQHMIRSTSASLPRRFARTRHASISTQRVVECGRLQPGPSWSGELIYIGLHYPLPFPADGIQPLSLVCYLSATCSCMHFVYIERVRVSLFRPNTNKFHTYCVHFGKIFGHVFLIWW